MCSICLFTPCKIDNLFYTISYYILCNMSKNFSKNTSRGVSNHSNYFNFDLLSDRHKSFISIYLPFIPSEFHYLFKDLHEYNDPPYIHAFIFSVWHCSQLRLSPPAIIITPQMAAIPYHSLLFHITHPSF